VLNRLQTGSSLVTVNSKTHKQSRIEALIGGQRRLGTGDWNRVLVTMKILE
ncbi:hypothetical protein KI387_044377, partial [Taxus chinensis]